MLSEKLSLVPLPLHSLLYYVLGQTFMFVWDVASMKTESIISSFLTQTLTSCCLLLFNYLSAAASSDWSVTGHMTKYCSLIGQFCSGALIQMSEQILPSDQNHTIMLS